MYVGWKVFAALLNFGATVILINKLGWQGFGLSLLITTANAIRTVTEEMEKKHISDLEEFARMSVKKKG